MEKVVFVFIILIILPDNKIDNNKYYLNGFINIGTLIKKIHNVHVIIVYKKWKRVNTFTL